MRLIIRDDRRSRHDLALIARGPRSYLGVTETPYDPDLAAGFAAGLPGLHDTEAEIARLREKRKLLEAELPSPDQVAQAEKEAAALLRKVAQGSWREDSPETGRNVQPAGCRNLRAGVQSLTASARTGDSSTPGALMACRLPPVRVQTAQGIRSLAK